MIQAVCETYPMLPPMLTPPARLCAEICMSESQKGTSGIRLILYDAYYLCRSHKLIHNTSFHSLAHVADQCAQQAALAAAHSTHNLRACVKDVHASVLVPVVCKRAGVPILLLHQNKF